MKRLFICNTYYQLIIAIQIRKSIYPHDEVDLMLSNESNNAEKTAHRVDELKLFSDVFVYSRQKSNNSLREKVISALRTNFISPSGMEIKKYDEILFYNLDVRLYQIADYYQKSHHHTQWSWFEEGVLSCNSAMTYGGQVKLIRWMRKRINRVDVASQITQYYCVHPELITRHKDFSLRRIPLIDTNDEKMRKCLNYIFEYELPSYHPKYIFLASSSDIDGWSYGETELILKIADTVGHDNLMVKVHPRDKRKVFGECGINIMQNSFVPWEVIQLNLVHSESVFLTATSGAFLNACALMDISVRGFFLDKCIDNNSKVFREKMNEIHSILEDLHRHNLCVDVKEYEI